MLFKLELILFLEVCSETKTGKTAEGKQAAGGKQAAVFDSEVGRCSSCEESNGVCIGMGECVL